MRRWILLVLAATSAACATGAHDLAVDHPASTHAPTGLLAGAPASLRPGVIIYADVPALRTAPVPAHHHHP